MRSWESIEVATGLEVHAVPARHGPADGVTNSDGCVNCEVTGFVIRTSDATIYVSGDNASVGLVREIRDRFGPVDYAVLFAGRASVPSKFDGRPLSFSAERASAAADVLSAEHVIIAHQTGWAHFTEGPSETIAAFEDAGLGHIVDRSALGEWSHPASLG